jgi:hypothetical protein
MSKFTERLLQTGIILAILFYGYNFAAQTVITILKQGQAVQQLTQELKKSQEELKNVRSNSPKDKK